MDSHLIELKHVSFSYEEGTEILKNLSVAINAGERIAVIGSNGSGKTTFFHYLKGLLPRIHGELFLHDQRIGKGKHEDLKLIKEIGYVFQDPDVQMIGATVENEISFGPLNMRMAEPEVAKRVNEVLEIMNLSSYRKFPPHLLSGGEKKRVSIADILVMEPTVFLFDEPTAFLDGKNQMIFEEILKESYMKEKTILISTHDMDFVWRWAERILFFHEGRIIGDGRPEAIFADKVLLEQTAVSSPLLYQMAEKVCDKYNYPLPDKLPKDIDGLLELLNDYF